MFNRGFYHSTIRKHVIVFGSMFNNIFIDRVDEDFEIIQTLKIPVTYGPRQKFIARLASMEKVTEDSTKPPIATILPRITFEIADIMYDGQRRLPKTVKLRVVGENNQSSYQYAPAPYNIFFKMSVMVKNAEDGTKIVEQILPFFSPDFTVTMNVIPELGALGKYDTPIILNSVQLNDEYDGPIQNRRVLTYDFQFTVKAMFFGPERGGKPIKIVNTNIYTPTVPLAEATPLNTNVAVNLNTRPGLTSLGEPTTSLDDTVGIEAINEDDNYGFIESITEYFGSE